MPPTKAAAGFDGTLYSVPLASLARFTARGWCGSPKRRANQRCLPVGSDKQVRMDPSRRERKSQGVPVVPSTPAILANMSMI